MKEASSTEPHRDFQAFVASAFRPYFFMDPSLAHSGCGATALAALTGVDPGLIAVENWQPHYSDKFMTGFLRKRGFQTLRLTRSVLVENGCSLDCGHVLLVSQQFTKNEGTWGIVFANNYMHNFDVHRLSNLWLLRKPLMSVHLVIHPSWRR